MGVLFKKVWMGQIVPNDILIYFTKLYQDYRAHAKQVIEHIPSSFASTAPLCNLSLG